jgi:heterotetrameric sarcosine oxidase gamma subunit
VVEPVPASPLARELQPGDHGRVGPDGPGVSFRERRDLAVVSIMAGPKARADVDAALQPLDLALPEVGGSHAGGDGTTVVWAALDRWHALSAAEDGAALLARLRAALGHRAALVDQTAGTCLIELAGPRLETVLEKATPVDLHAFPVGATRATSINHLSVHLWKSAADTMLVSVPRSFGRDLLEFLHEMALEVGYRDRR